MNCREADKVFAVKAFQQRLVAPIIKKERSFYFVLRCDQTRHDGAQ
jgi:hypothetical protein